MTTPRLLSYAVGALAASIIASLPAAAQDACPNRGQLDTMYCDRDGDLGTANGPWALLPDVHGRAKGVLDGLGKHEASFHPKSETFAG